MRFQSMARPISYLIIMASTFAIQVQAFQADFESCARKHKAFTKYWLRWDSYSYRHGDIAVYSKRGTRYTNIEDRFSIVEDQGLLGFAVYDGHGGQAVSSYMEKHFLPSLIQQFHSSPSEQTIKAQFLAHDNRAMELQGGSTAVIGVVHTKYNKLYIANLGDSRAVVKLSDSVWQTTDHKPNVESEKDRIIREGGSVTPEGYYLSCKDDNKQLGVSRAMGDAHFKKCGVTAEAVVTQFDLNRTPLQYMIMASDGLWDVFGNKVEETLDFVQKYIDKEDELFGTKELAMKAIYKGSTDDVTVMVIKFGGTSHTVN